MGQQHERFCIRRERGKCVGCFSSAAGDFDISGIGANEAVIASFTVAGGCCGYYTVRGLSGIATLANVAQNGYGNALGGQFGWDCVIIPGAFFATNTAAGASEVIQSVADLQQVLGNSPTAATMNTPQGPQICGSGAGIGPGVAIIPTMSIADATVQSDGIADATGLTVCTRYAPFTLEFMSDDIEGQGTTSTEFGTATQTYNQGFNIQHLQLDC